MADPTLNATRGYTTQQYSTSPCAGQGFTADTCPTMLPCRVTTEAATSSEGCTVRILPGFSWNPSVVRAPRWLLASLGMRHGPVAYIATTRTTWGNLRVQCDNPFTESDWENRMRQNRNNSASDMLLLDEGWRVLHRMPITGEAGTCAAGPLALADARLLVAGADEDLYISSFSSFANRLVQVAHLPRISPFHALP